MRKTRKRFKRFYKRNKHLYNSKIIKGFNLGLKVNTVKILTRDD